MVIDKLAITDIGTTKASKPLNNMAQHPEEHQNTAAVTAVTETATKDRWAGQNSPLLACAGELIFTLSLNVVILPLVCGRCCTLSTSECLGVHYTAGSAELFLRRTACNFVSYRLYQIICYVRIIDFSFLPHTAIIQVGLFRWLYRHLQLKWYEEISECVLLTETGRNLEEKLFHNHCDCDCLGLFLNMETNHSEQLVLSPS